MSYFRGFVFLILLSIVFPVLGNPHVYTLTLKDAIFLSLRYNQRLKSAEFQRVVDKFNLRVTEWNYEFQYAITGSLNTARIKSNNFLSHSQSYNLHPQTTFLTQNGGFVTVSMDNNSNGKFYNPLVTVNIQQPLIRGFRRSVVLAPLYNALDQESISQMILKSIIINNVTTVINDFNAVVQNENALRIQEEALIRAQENVKNIEAQIKAGTSAPMDLPQATINVSQSQLALTQLQNILVQSINQLLLDIGLDPNTPIDVPANIKIEEYPIPDVEQSIEIALLNDPTYQTDLLNQKIGERVLLVARDNELWQLNASLQGTWGGGSGPVPNNNLQSLFNGTNTGQAVGLTLVVPINNLALKQAEVAAKIALDQLCFQTEFDKNNLITNVKNSIRQIITAQRSLEFSLESAKLAKQNLANTLKLFTYGRTTQLAVSQQQDALTQAEQVVLANQIQYLNAITNYEQITQTTLDKWKISICY